MDGGGLAAVHRSRSSLYTGTEEVGETIIRLIPAERDESFVGVDVGSGEGWLSRLILERFPRSQMLLLDGSETMLKAAEQSLIHFRDRVELRQFHLEASDWREELPPDLRCAVSSLVVHHLDDSGKQKLYKDLYHRLCDPAPLLIFDCVAPASEIERLEMADAWDDEVRNRSLALTSSLEAYQEFLASEWNWHRYPDDPVDKPSAVGKHLAWLGDAGFNAAVFWMRAGHAIYGGFKGVVSFTG